jgi:hypothetical protein
MRIHDVDIFIFKYEYKLHSIQLSDRSMIDIVELHCVLGDPINVLGNMSVDAWFVSHSTAIAPARYASKFPFAVLGANKRTAAVALWKRNNMDLLSIGTLILSKFHGVPLRTPLWCRP